jgi:hypothetical protein
MINMIKSCVMCDSEFTPRLPGKEQIYCSKICKRQFEKEVRKLGLQALKLNSPILNACVKKKEDE